MSQIHPIQWCADYEIGVAEIDLQHRNLVRLFNDGNAGLHATIGLAGWESFSYDFLGYALYHFSTEEKLAEAYGYGRDEPVNALSHHAEHQAFVAQLTNIRQEFATTGKITKVDVMNFIQGWLIKHIRHDDVPLGDFIRTRRKTA